MLDSLQLCLHEDQINVLRSEENKMYHVLKKQILNSSTEKYGSICEQVIQINEEMTKRLGIRIDLRKANLINEDEGNEDTEQSRKDKHK